MPKPAQFDLSGAAALAFGSIVLAAASTTTAPAQQTAPTGALQQRDQELDAVRAQQHQSIDAEKKLKSDIDALGEERRKLNQSLIDTAARVRAAEDRLTETEARLKPLQGQEADIRQSLDSRRSVLIEVLAALQRMGRHPPPALMVRPEDALQSLRTAMMLGAVLPELKDKAEALARDLTELTQIRSGIEAEQSRLARDIGALNEERQRMTSLVEERRSKQANAEKTLDSEKQRAATLSQQAGNLKDLIAKLETGLDSATRSARAAARAAEDAKLQNEARPNLAVLKDPGRLAPAINFASARGLLPLPVNGIKIREFGAGDSSGGTEKGQSIATRAGAQVTSPCDGWVVYSAPYRNYGQLLILNAGGGYHVLLAGMDRISVDLGQFVLTGEPVAVMGGGPQLATNVAIGSSQPVLYVEFRKDGTPVDPSPWWVTSEGEKVRG